MNKHLVLIGVMSLLLSLVTPTVYAARSEVPSAFAPDERSTDRSYVPQSSHVLTATLNSSQLQPLDASSL